jgi:hypothetical protein
MVTLLVIQLPSLYLAFSLLALYLDLFEYGSRPKDQGTFHQVLPPCHCLGISINCLSTKHFSSNESGEEFALQC